MLFGFLGDFWEKMLDFLGFWGYFGGFWAGLGVGLPMRYRVGFGDFGVILGDFRGFWVILVHFGLFLWILGWSWSRIADEG